MSFQGKSLLWKYYHHQVVAKIEGTDQGRIISLGMKEGIILRKIKYIDDTTLMATMDYEDYKKLKKIAKSIFKVSMVKEFGAGVTYRRFARNRLFATGLGIFILFFICQSLFVSEIEIEGLKSIPEDKLRKVLQGQGLYEGGLKNFNCKKIEKSLFQDFETIVYADVSYEGRYVRVVIAENEQFTGKSVDREKPASLVAEKSCYIESVEAYLGKAKVKEGDYVKKGKVLISGKVPIEYFSYEPKEDDPENYYVHAQGKIVAKVPYFYSFTMPKGTKEKIIKQKVNIWIEENIPKNALVLNKGLNFTAIDNIIRVYGIIETRETIGIEKEILVDKGNGRTEKTDN